MKKLCANCGREFEAKTRIETEQRYGKSPVEREVEDEICPDCVKDLGLEDDPDDEGIELEEENEDSIEDIG